MFLFRGKWSQRTRLRIQIWVPSFSIFKAWSNPPEVFHRLYIHPARLKAIPKVLHPTLAFFRHSNSFRSIHEKAFLRSKFPVWTQQLDSQQFQTQTNLQNPPLDYQCPKQEWWCIHHGRNIWNFRERAAWREQCHQVCWDRHLLIVSQQLRKPES